MSAPGTYPNPSHKACWETCSACFRCENKGRYAKCVTCSGRHDPFGSIDYDHDDYCECSIGVLRWRSNNGQLIIRRYHSNPFKGTVQQEVKTEDERDWQTYLNEYREKLDNPTWDPIQVTGLLGSKYDSFSGEFKVLENFS